MMLTQHRIDEEKERFSAHNDNANLSNKPSRSQSVCMEGQNEININGVPILFPFEPYECQIKYMSKVIEALNKVWCIYNYIYLNIIIIGLNPVINNK